MNDKELCKMFGTTLEDVADNTGRYEQGDFSDFDFSKTMLGRPLEKEKMTMVSTQVPRSRVEAIKRIAKKEGISRSEFVRRAIDHELMEKA